MFSPGNSPESTMRNYAMLRPTFESIGIDMSPWLIIEIKNGNENQLRTLIYNLYIAVKKLIKR